MSDLPSPEALDAALVQRLAAAHGVHLQAGEAERLAGQVGPQLERLRAMTTVLWADDDMLAFRRLLEREAALA